MKLENRRKRLDTTRQGISFVFLITCTCFFCMVHPEKIDEANCGLSEAVPRIYNGKIAARKQVPWIVHWCILPRLSEGGDTLGLCGGSIISRTFVLTAAHCIPDDTQTEDSVVLIFYNTTVRSRGPWTTAKKIFTHPDYRSESVSNDIALLQLSRSLDFDDFVQPVCLRKSPWEAVGKPLFLAGWGATNEGRNGPASDVLRYTTLKEAPYEVCEPCGGGKRFNKSGIICSYANSSSPKRGDSGGPVTTLAKNGKSVQVGVVSWIAFCQKNARNSGFTKVPTYMSWIKSIVTAYEAE